LPVFRPKEFLISEDSTEILDKLKEGGKSSFVIAGGTGFYELAKRGYIPEVKKVVSIMKLGLDYIRSENGVLKIGATTTLQKLMEWRTQVSGFEAIWDSLKEIHPVQIRNVATVGGEVCISVPLVDLPTALLACDASIVVMKKDGSYEMALDDFYIDAFLTKLKYGEIVKEIDLPTRSKHVRSAFVKFGRTAYDFNLINAAISLSLGKDSKLDSLKVILGGIKRTPIRAAEFERRILGKSFDEKLVMSVAESSFSKEDFLPSVHGSNEYKHAVLPVVLRDCLAKAYDRASGSE
jgi:aerobic carbon-monoxide dehydrogenase medium subunit